MSDPVVCGKPGHALEPEKEPWFIQQAYERIAAAEKACRTLATYPLTICEDAKYALYKEQEEAHASFRRIYDEQYPLQALRTWMTLHVDVSTKDVEQLLVAAEKQIQKLKEEVKYWEGRAEWEHTQ